MINNFENYESFDPTGMSNDCIPTEESQTNGMAIASLVCGILSSLLCCCSPLMGTVLDILAIVFGVRGMRHQNGHDMATAGFVIGIVMLVISIAAILFCAFLEDVL